MEYVRYTPYAGCLLALLLLAFGLVWLRRRGRFSWQIGRPASLVCARCHGRGWLDRTERTLTFTGDGFADRHRPASLCQDCDGTGHRPFR